MTYVVAASAPDTLYYAPRRVPRDGRRDPRAGRGGDGGRRRRRRGCWPARREPQRRARVWLSYNKIRCVTPPWDGLTDDDRAHGGHQVTVFVTNDGAKYSAGFGDGDGAGVDDGGDDDPGNDVGVYRARGAACHVHVLRRERVRGPTKVRSGVHALDVDLALRGGPKAAARRFSPSDAAGLSAASLSGAYFYHRELEETHSFSDAYDDFGRRKAHKVNQSLVALEAAANATAAVALLADGDPANDVTSARRERSPLRLTERTRAAALPSSRWWSTEWTERTSRPCGGGNTSGVSTRRVRGRGRT